MGHPSYGYGIWFYNYCTPPTISLVLLLCPWMWGIFPWWVPASSCQWMFNSCLWFWYSHRRRWAHILPLHHFWIELTHDNIWKQGSVVLDLAHLDCEALLCRFSRLFHWIYFKWRQHFTISKALPHIFFQWPSQEPSEESMSLEYWWLELHTIFSQ